MRVKVLPLVNIYITKEAVLVRPIGDHQITACEIKALCRTLSHWERGRRAARAIARTYDSR